MHERKERGGGEHMIYAPPAERVAVVTGASSGIGAATTQALLSMAFASTLLLAVRTGWRSLQLRLAASRTSSTSPSQLPSWLLRRRLETLTCWSTTLVSAGWTAPLLRELSMTSAARSTPTSPP